MYQDIFFFSNRLETVAAHSLADRLDDAEGGGIFDSYEFAFNIYYYAELTLPTDARFFAASRQLQRVPGVPVICSCAFIHKCKPPTIS